MPKDGNTMWNGNYGSDESKRRSGYDRGAGAYESIPSGVSASKLKGMMEPIPNAKAIPKDVAKSLLDK